MIRRWGAITGAGLATAAVAFLLASCLVAVVRDSFWGQDAATWGLILVSILAAAGAVAGVWRWLLPWMEKARRREPPRGWAPASLGKGFFGREQALGDIGQAFKNHRAVVVSGGAGTGKTRLAAEYIHGIKKARIWTSAAPTADGTYAALAPALEVDTGDLDEAGIATRVKDGLAGMPASTMWAIDGLPDLSFVNALIGESGQIRLLLTTRDARRELLLESATMIELEPVDPEAAVSILCSRRGADPDHPLLGEIAEAVGRLPLALEMLAIRLREPTRSPRTVLDEIGRAPTTIQFDAFMKEAETSIPRAEGVFNTVATTLSSLDPATRTVISGFGYVADAPVPEELALALLGLGEEEFRDLLGECQRQSLLSYAEGTVVVHALTSAGIAATNREGAFDVALEAATGRLSTINRDDPVAMRVEVIHYEAFRRHAVRLSGSESSTSLRLANNLAIGCRALGRNKDAARLDEETLEIRERVLGPEHPHTLVSRNNLAVGYRALGRNEDAVRLHEETLEIRERVLGREHPDTLTSRSNLAIGYRALDREEEAEQLEEMRGDSGR